MSGFSKNKMTTIGGIVMGAVVIAFVLFEFFYLRGETVCDEWASLGDTVKFTVSKPNQPYLLEFSDRRSKKRQGLYTLKVSVLNPDGEEVVTYDETIPRKRTRHIEFTPKTAGDYTIKISGKGLTQNPRLRVEVLVNDKRISRRFSF
jgi:hypothetical protein